MSTCPRRRVRHDAGRPLRHRATELVVAFEHGLSVIPLRRCASPLQRADRQGRHSIARAYAFGRLDMVENRRVGIKSREPTRRRALGPLIAAHRDSRGSSRSSGTCITRRPLLNLAMPRLIYDGLLVLAR